MAELDASDYQIWVYTQVEEIVDLCLWKNRKVPVQVKVGGHDEKRRQREQPAGPRAASTTGAAIRAWAMATTVAVWIISGFPCPAQTAPTREYIRLGGRVIAIENSTQSVTVTADCGTGPLGPGESRQCTASVQGGTPATVNWIASVGTIGTSGLYQAPATVTTQQTATITAQWTGDQSRAATATITVNPLLVPVSATIPAAGVTDQTVSVTRNSAWTATASDTWIHVISGGGSAPGVVHYSVDPNTGTGQRIGALTIAGQTFAIVQSAPDAVGVSPTSGSLPVEGGSGQFQVVTSGSWSISSNSAWLSASPTSGNGGQTVTYSAAVNSGTSRIGTLTVGTTPFTVTQAGCSATFNPSVAPMFLDTGGDGSVIVTSGCAPWSAASTAAWLTVTSGASGSGNGTVTYHVAVNTGPYRHAPLTIAGLAYEIQQKDCFESLALSRYSDYQTPAAGTGAAITVTTTCAAWTAQSNVSWLHITGGANGGGPVTYTYDQNTGTANRTGTLTIGNKSFNVTQAAMAEYEIEPTTVTLSANQSWQFHVYHNVNGVRTEITNSISWTQPLFGQVNASGLYTAPAFFTDGQREPLQAGNGSFTIQANVILRWPSSNTGTQVFPVDRGGWTQTFNVWGYYTYLDSGSALRQVLFNPTATSSGGCHFLFGFQSLNPPSFVVYLRNDAGDGIQGSGQLLGQQGTPAYAIENSQCGIDANTATGLIDPIQPLGGNIKYTLPVKFKTAFGGTKNIYAMATGDWGASRGTWAIPPQTLTVQNQTITSGTSTQEAGVTLTSSGVTINGSAAVTYKAGTTVRLLPEFRATAGSAAVTFRATAGQ